MIKSDGRRFQQLLDDGFRGVDRRDDPRDQLEHVVGKIHFLSSACGEDALGIENRFFWGSLRARYPADLDPGRDGLFARAIRSMTWAEAEDLLAAARRMRSLALEAQ